MMLSFAPSAWAVSLNLGDILVADAGRQAVIAINSSTGAQSLITSGNLLQQAVGVGFMASGEIVVADRINGLIRVNPVTGAQSVLSSFVNSDTFAVAVDASGYIWVADSGYDVSTGRAGINYAGRIFKVDPATGKQYLIAQGDQCTVRSAPLPKP